MDTDSETKEYKSPNPEAQLSDITDLISNKTGSNAIDIERLDSGYVNAVYFARTEDDRDLVVKISPKQREWEQFEQEAYAYNRCREVGIPTPEVVACDASKTDFQEAYILMNRLPGKSGDLVDLTKDQRLGIAQELGDIFGKMHAIKVPRFGYLVQQEDGSFEGRHKTLWDDLRHDLYDGWWIKAALESGILSDSDLAYIRKQFEDNRSLFTLQQGSLVHKDISMGLKNVMIEDGRVSGIIDMEDVRSTDPIQDFAYFSFWRDGEEEYFEALKEGYPNQDLFDEDFEHKLLLYQLLYSYQLSTWYHNEDRHDLVQQMKDKMDSIKGKLSALNTPLTDTE